MEVSIIIVNYNVKHYLSICLDSILAAIVDLEAEIIVIDNHSSDGSVSYLKNHFPSIQLIQNKENIGFGKACNLGIAVAKGNNILFINPDTVVGENTLLECVQQLNSSAEIGALGIQLIDGKGQVLPESKRSTPSLFSSGFKFLGLTSLFPKIAYFNDYYAPHIGYAEQGNIEVLPGAFMFVKKEVLDQVKGFDPRFFMYAEDIDLSYRIREKGYKIMYDGGISAIHFKGESTRKSLLSYTDSFFTSMALFIKKYRGQLYGNWEARILLAAVTIIKYVKALYTLTSQIFTKTSKDKKWSFNNTVLLTNDRELKSILERDFSPQSFVMAYEGRDHQPGIPLRYIAEYLRLNPSSQVILDSKHIKFEKMVSIMKKCPGIQYFLSDSARGFLLISDMKDKQGFVIAI